MRGIEILPKGSPGRSGPIGVDTPGPEAPTPEEMSLSSFSSLRACVT